MKIWTGYGTEHSANLVIIGKFKTIEDANSAHMLISELTELVNDEENKGITKHGLVNGRFSKSMLTFLGNKNFPSLGYADLNGLLDEYSMEQNENDIVVTSNDMDFASIIKVIIHYSGKVEIYSAHDYPSAYGRQT
jgi:hypothetical protein